MHGAENMISTTLRSGNCVRGCASVDTSSMGAAPIIRCRPIVDTRRFCAFQLAYMAALTTVSGLASHCRDDLFHSLHRFILLYVSNAESSWPKMLLFGVQGR